MSPVDGFSLPALLHDLDTAVVIHDPGTGRVVDATEPAKELYGYSRDQLQGMTIEELTPPSTKFTGSDGVSRIRAAADGDPQRFEWQIERSNGELRWVRIHLTDTAIDRADYVVAEVEDITEYRAREQRLRLLSRVVRHNLRNRTNVLMGYADQIRTEIEDESVEDAVETIMDITTEVGSLSDSVRQLEEIAEPDATERSATELRTFVEPLVDEFGEEYPDARITFEAARAVHVVADQGLRYAVEHAIENAIEHNDQPTPTVSVTVAEGPSGNGEIRIADDGPRIPESEIEVLEEDVEASSTYHGSGIGLWIIQWCVDSLGGELVFEENTPRGNVITMRLPKAPERTAE